MRMRACFVLSCFACLRRAEEYVHGTCLKRFGEGGGERRGWSGWLCVRVDDEQRARATFCYTGGFEFSCWLPLLLPYCSRCGPFFFNFLIFFILSYLPRGKSVGRAWQACQEKQPSLQKSPNQSASSTSSTKQQASLNAMCRSCPAMLCFPLFFPPSTAIGGGGTFLFDAVALLRVIHEY